MSYPATRGAEIPQQYFIIRYTCKGKREKKKTISSSLDLTCGWLRILLDQAFWISSNRYSAVVPINGVDAAAAAGAGGGEGSVGAASGYSSVAGAGVGAGAGARDRARYGAGSGALDVAPSDAIGKGTPYCADNMLLYPWPHNNK